ncbi:hypothetical protein BDV38DRAFT_276443 [Aspergillus pseudotamarii]|uniref:Uncharacterized protein n=1 Tax=Aspergillus pseudotamarii TaxID=132259 RepID=A0A5N6SB22_ASPPS|nr:uncharacterized protein BDV38DRAFT_276443 [Aspergillus pseudotamarii]KAE8130861.1 hypothetical protein BDV38DRAFT_276443 [Aspergillus pseudotamarii]
MAEFPQEGSRYSKRWHGLRQRDLQMETHPRRTLSGRLVLAWAEVSDFKLDLMLHPRYRNRHTENIGMDLHKLCGIIVPLPTGEGKM